MNLEIDRRKNRPAGSTTAPRASRWLPELAGIILLVVALMNTSSLLP